MNRTPGHGGGRGNAEQQEGGASGSHRDLAGRKGDGVLLGSYGQSGGANSTRKTWGALVGETGRSHLTRAVTLGEPRGIGCSRGFFKVTEKEP